MQYEPFLASLLIEIFSNQNSNYQPIIEIYEARKAIFCPGDPAQRIYCLVKGAIKLSKLNESREITLALLSPNSLVGVLPLITTFNSEQLYQAVALTSVEVLCVPVNQFQLALQEEPELCIFIVEELSKRLLQAQEMIEILVHPNPGFRVVRFLLFLGSNFGVSTTDGIEIELKLTHQMLAQIINSSRVTVTRILGHLRQKQLILVAQKKITIYKPEVLHKMAEIGFREDA